MTRAALVTYALIVLFLPACREGAPAAPTPDGAAPGSRVVGNCVMTPALCPSRYCLPQHDGTFLCACADIPAGQSCAPCPPGYRYHGKYSSCEPTCDVVAPTCKTGETCQDLFGVATCMPADGGAGSAADTSPPTGQCTCNSGCAADEKCLQNKLGGIGPGDAIICNQPPKGLAECRKLCDASRPCPASRPHCVGIPLAPMCCSVDTLGTPLCCANAEAKSVDDCF
jgi:hypothetical protein